MINLSPQQRIAMIGWHQSERIETGVIKKQIVSMEKFCLQKTKNHMQLFANAPMNDGTVVVIFKPLFFN